MASEFKTLYISAVDSQCEPTGESHILDLEKGYQAGFPSILCGDSVGGLNWTGQIVPKTKTVCKRCLKTQKEIEIGREINENRFRSETQ